MLGGEGGGGRRGQVLEGRRGGRLRRTRIQAQLHDIDALPLTPNEHTSLVVQQTNSDCLHKRRQRLMMIHPAARMEERRKDSCQQPWTAGEQVR